MLLLYGHVCLRVCCRWLGEPAASGSVTKHLIRVRVEKEKEKRKKKNTHVEMSAEFRASFSCCHHFFALIFHAYKM